MLGPRSSALGSNLNRATALTTSDAKSPGCEAGFPLVELLWQSSHKSLFSLPFILVDQAPKRQAQQDYSAGTCDTLENLELNKRSNLMYEGIEPCKTSR